MMRSGFWATFVVGLIVTCLVSGCNGVFYQPDDVIYTDPAKQGIPFQERYIPLANGAKLHSWLFPPRQDDHQALVVHFHGNAQNLTAHALFSQWLADYGYHVLAFDYQGYGRSTGEPTRAGLVSDAMGVLAYIKQDPELSKLRLIILAQSLGGAVAIPSLVLSDTKPAMVIIDSSFASYHDVAQSILDRHPITWSLQWLPWLLVSDDYSPRDYLPRLRSPLLVIHSKMDNIVPFANGKDIFDLAPEPKDFWVLPYPAHTAAFYPESPYRQKLVSYLTGK